MANPHPHSLAEIAARSDPNVWVTAEGERIRVSDMADSHLLNTERMLLGRGLRIPTHRAEMFAFHYDAIRAEIDRRGLTLLDEDHPGAHERAGRGAADA